MGFDLTGLSKYTDEKKLDLIRKTVMDTKFQSLVNLQTGVVGKTAINILSTTPTLQDGTSCGFTAQGSAKFTQRMIDPKNIKVNMTFCEKDLQSYYMNYQIRQSEFHQWN